jgi:hypothetical protein
LPGKRSEQENPIKGIQHERIAIITTDYHGEVSLIRSGFDGQMLFVASHPNSMGAGHKRNPEVALIYMQLAGR